MASKPVAAATYTSGHHESVLRSHSWRTAANSAAYLLPHLRPSMHILDVGCGPGTITADLAALVPEGSVTGLENESGSSVLSQARANADGRGLSNVTFTVGDIHALPFAEDTFDVVHLHQVLQHVGDPVHALHELRRVTKKGDGRSIIAIREADFEAMTWFPRTEGLEEWQALYLSVARHNGGEPNAGRRLLSWALEAGCDAQQVECSASTWCFSTQEERDWWSGMWAERTVGSAFAEQALQSGIAERRQLEMAAEAWKRWGQERGGWFGMMHGEILCRQ